MKDCQSVSPESCRLVFLCKMLNTARTGNAGLDVWISSKQLCRADGDSCPLQHPFLSVRVETETDRCWLLTRCTSSLWEGSSDFWSSSPSLLRSLLLCCAACKKIGAILMSFAQTAFPCSWSGLTFMAEMPAAAAAATSEPCVSFAAIEADSVSSSLEQLESDNTTVVTSAALGCFLRGHEASLRFSLRLSLFRIVMDFKRKDSPVAFWFWRLAVMNDAGGNVSLCDGYFRQKRQFAFTPTTLANCVTLF